MRSILLVVDESTKAMLGKRLDKLGEKVFLVVAKDPDQTMSTIKEYIALMKVVDKLVDHGIIIDERGNFELSYEFVRDMSEKDRKKGNPVLMTLRDPYFNATMRLNDDELVRATVFIEGFLEDARR